MRLARDIKRIGGNEMNKTMFTRLTGALFSYGRCYAVYNSRDSVMKWSGMGEIKTVNNLIEICRYNSNIKTVDSAILMGESYEAALTTVMESNKSIIIFIRQFLLIKWKIVYRYTMHNNRLTFI